MQVRDLHLFYVKPSVTLTDTKFEFMKKIDGVRIEYRIKDEKAVTGGIVTHSRYISQEEVPNKLSELFEMYDVEWVMIDRYYRRTYDRVNM